jgi:predicted RNA-binding Zn-ribbon protein involved in translation (DUF1610 family)
MLRRRSFVGCRSRQESARAGKQWQLIAMFGDYSRDLLRSGIIEAKAGNRSEARRYLDRALYMSSDHDVMAEAWFWISQITDAAGEKRQALENCLANDLQHARARRALAVLDGKLRPDEIVDPDRLPPVPSSVQPAEARRFMCPRCGGRMSYSPDGNSLVCDYCVRNQALKGSGKAAGEEDFIIGMAKAAAHRHPLRERVLHCQGCGAEFILPATQLSFRCAYCGSPEVVSLKSSDELLAPDGVLPHAFDQRHARDLLADWIEGLKIEPEKEPADPRGLYLPAWSFTLGGGIDYTGETRINGRERSQGALARQPDVRGRYPVMLTVAIAASRKPSAPFVKLIPSYNLQAAQPYDAGFLAAWPAELYDVPMAEASLEARSQAYTTLKRELPARLAPLHITSTSSAPLTVESFRLDLLPVWVGEIWYEGRRHIVLINGQNGVTQSDIQKRLARTMGLMDWLGDLIKD